MSYCRNNGEDSDVYVIMTRDPSGEPHNVLECFCNSPRHTFAFRSEMITHLIKHQQRGDKVPVRAFHRLYQEIEEEGDQC